ncbi:DegT/DnrJ/EryC1/StrS family aminotransferase [candidate division KSB1 bacterium]|nr:DegT/DnrJ/EryC1/StrS family aminotransferase [candidate division KSB1 bacterium]
MKPSRRVPIGDFAFTPEIRANFEKIFQTNRVTYGPFLREFETQFAAIHQRKYGVFCVSGTSALHVALKILKNYHNWQDNDEILVPALTFVASSNVVLHERLKPVFVEIEKDFFDMDPSRIEENITPKTRAIMPVHLFGMPCRMTEIAQIAEKHGLVILEDCCQCTFGKIENQPVGSWSPMSCFSTYCGSLIFTGVGGLILTDDFDLQIRTRQLLAHGRDEKYLSIDDDDKLNRPDLLEEVVQKRFAFVDLGFSFRMTEFEGAMGLPQVYNIEWINRQRCENAEILISALSDIPIFQLPSDRPNAKRAYRMFPIKINGTKKMRNSVSFFLERHGIETRPLLPLLDQPYYQKLYGNISEQYPIARDVGNTGFYIGCHEYLEPEDLEYAISVIHEAVKGMY